jgi:hypothetical protein
VIGRVVQVPIYVLVVGIATVLLSPLASFFASVQIAERNAEQVRAKQAAAQVVATRLACEQFGRLIDVYGEATTPIGREVRGVYVFLYTLIRCEPARK